MQYLNVIKKGLRKVPDIGKAVLAFTSKNSPAILSGFAVAGTIGSVIFAVKATPKAMRAIEAEQMAREEEMRKSADQSEYIAEKLANGEIMIPEVTKWEMVKLSWKYYIPTALSAAGTVVCIIGAQKINDNRLSALATALSLSETARKDLEDKVAEKFGEGKLERLKSEIAAEEINRIPDSSFRNVTETGHGNVIFIDYWSKEVFRSSVEYIRTVQNNLNTRMLGGNEFFIPLNEMYYELGLEQRGCGENFGWGMETTGPVNLTNIYWFSKEINGQEHPVGLLSYDVKEKYKYGDF